MSPLLRRIGALLLCSIMASVVIAEEKKDYPESGKIIGTRLTEHPRTTPVYTDPYGKTWGGVHIRGESRVYKVETDTRIYEIEGGSKSVFELDEVVRFRIEKDKAYVLRRDKEQKFRIVSVEQRPRS